jgi:hypothetical protein
MMLNSAKSAALGARIRDLVEDGLQRQGVSARRASMDVVGHDGLIRDIRAGRIPSFDRLVCLFEYLAIPVEFGGQAAPTPGVAEDDGSGAPGFAGPEALRAGFLPFPWHRMAGRRGMGPVAFSGDWLTERQLAPDTLSFVAPDLLIADPTDGHRPLALVDQAARRAGGPALWCYVENGKTALARAHWQNRSILVLSGDGPQAIARVLIGAEHERVQFLGRVVWLGSFVQEA